MKLVQMLATLHAQKNSKNPPLNSRAPTTVKEMTKSSNVRILPP